jgi:hypothetical protein
MPYIAHVLVEVVIININLQNYQLVGLLTEIVFIFQK